MSYELAELDRRLAALFLEGVVESVDYGNPAADPPILPTVRVRVGEWLSTAIPMPTTSAGGVRIWNPLRVGEQVLLANPSGKPEKAWIIARAYTTQHGGANGSDGDNLLLTMPDGAVIGYNSASGALTAIGIQSAAITASGAVTVNAANLNLTGATTINGDLTMNGNINASGYTVTADNIP